MDTTVPTRRASLRDVSPGRLSGVGARVVLDELIGAEARPVPLALADWPARLAGTWAHHTAKIDSYARANARESARTCDAYAHAANMLVAPLLSELTELKAVTLVNWRQALRVHAEAELALIDSEMAVAL